MADLIWDLLSDSDVQQSPSRAELQYLAGLASQSLTSLVEDEPRSQSQTLHTLSISVQSVCKRSHRAIVGSADRHASLSRHLARLSDDVTTLNAAVPGLDHAAVTFSIFGKTTSDSTSAALRRRRRALLLSRNCERIVDVMCLPNLLEAAASSLSSHSSALASAANSSAATSSSALDLNAHILRLHALYPSSPLISSVSSDARSAVHAMACTLIATLRQKSLKLAVAVRAVGWLRRILPELSLGPTASRPEEREQCLAGIFLACRAATLAAILSDLEPLRQLAEKEASSDSAGQHTERYLKRYIEIFREQSFSMLSMLRNLFPAGSAPDPEDDNNHDPLRPAVSPMSTFSLRLVDLLTETLAGFLGNVKSQPLYDGLITQLMYCSASLGRLGGDFSVALACLGPSASGDRWEEAIRRHMALTSRIESMVGGDHNFQADRSAKH